MGPGYVENFEDSRIHHFMKTSLIATARNQLAGEAIVLLVSPAKRIHSENEVYRQVNCNCSTKTSPPVCAAEKWLPHQSELDEENSEWHEHLSYRYCTYMTVLRLEIWDVNAVDDSVVLWWTESLSRNSDRSL